MRVTFINKTTYTNIHSTYHLLCYLPWFWILHPRPCLAWVRRSVPQPDLVSLCLPLLPWWPRSPSPHLVSRLSLQVHRCRHRPCLKPTLLPLHLLVSLCLLNLRLLNSVNPFPFQTKKKWLTWPAKVRVSLPPTRTCLLTRMRTDLSLTNLSTLSLTLLLLPLMFLSKQMPDVWWLVQWLHDRCAGEPE